MQFLQKAIDILNKKGTYYFFTTLVVLLSLILWFINRNVPSGDHYTYLYYIKGFEEGRYSYWYFLKDYIPDTFRNPGFPLFLYGLSFISKSVVFIQFIQWILLMVALYLMLRIIEYYDNSFFLKNLFLILVLFNFVTLSYTAFIFPENLVLFVVTFILFIELKWPSSWKKTIVLVLLYGFCFQLRPIILFIPFIRFGYYLLNQRKERFAFTFTFIFIFILTLLPYAFWNKKHHDVFKITPLEGGGGVMYLSYWSPKMLNNVETRYWRNVMYEDILFNFVEKKEIAQNIKLFNQEFDSIDQICSKYLTARDSIQILEMKKHPELFITYNSKYTIVREDLLKKLAVKHFLSDLSYTIPLKVYTFFRLWFTGLAAHQLEQNDVSKLVPSLILFVTTFITLILFLVYFLWALVKDRKSLLILIIPLFWCVYFAGIHVPFAIQSRYTIPVRFFYLFILAFLMYQFHFKNRIQKDINS